MSDASLFGAPDSCDPTPEELLIDSGQGQCLDCGEWFAPTGEPFHPGCRNQINEVRIFMSI